MELFSSFVLGLEFQKSVAEGFRLRCVNFRREYIPELYLFLHFKYITLVSRYHSRTHFP